MKETEPWVEKYRPQTLDDLVTRSEVVETCLQFRFSPVYLSQSSVLQ